MRHAVLFIDCDVLSEVCVLCDAVCITGRARALSSLFRCFSEARESFWRGRSALNETRLKERVCGVWRKRDKARWLSPKVKL